MAISQPAQTFVDEASDPAVLNSRIALANQDGGIVVFETPKDIYVTAVEQRVTYQQIKNVTNEAAGTSRGEIQFVNNGKFDADSDFKYDPDSDTLSINGVITTGNIVVSRTANLGAVGNVKITGGTTGQVLTTDGAGSLSWATIGTDSLSNGTSNVSIATASGPVTVTAAGSNTWSFNANASLQLPSVTIAAGRNEQTQLASQRKIIPGSRSSATIPGQAIPTVVYTVSAVSIVAFKVSLTIQHQTAGLEFVDVMASRSGSDVGFTVTNWVGPSALPDSDIDVTLDGGGRLQITVTTNVAPSEPAYVTYDATEYGRPTA